MLKNGRVAARLPAQDLERARAFYAEKLGLEPGSASVHEPSKGAARKPALLQSAKTE